MNERDIEEAANAEGVDFGYGPDDIWTPALTLWAFLSQVLHTGSSRSCAAAVSRAIVLLMTLGREPCSDDTGEYCRARAKLPESLLKRLTTQVADELEDRVPGDWLWQGRHVKLVDGTTMEMPDTPANQASFPQNPTQAPGLGFPIARTVISVSLASAAICGLALGPYQGNESGETALFRQLFEQLDEGDVVLADRYYCSYLMIALLLSHGVDTVARRHQCRKSTRGQRLGNGDRLVEWPRPACPDWMDESTYATIPQTLVVREVEVNVEQAVFARSSSLWSPH